MQPAMTPMKFDCCSLCGPIADIKPTIHIPGQGWTINPLFDTVKKFWIAADPHPLTLAAGEAREVSIAVQPEENHFGDFLISELMISTNPTTARFALDIRSRQNDKSFMNAPVMDRFVGSNAQICKTLPCCFFLQATSFAQIGVRNLSGVQASIRIVARGRRVLPYKYPHLREALLGHFAQQRSTPYWLTVDRVFAPGTALDGGGVTIPAGQSTVVNMTVPGAGDFEAKELLTLVDNVDPNAIFVDIKEGNGRSLMSEPLPLGDFVAAPNTAVAGLQGGEYRAASSGHCDQFTQLFKRNTRLRIELENTGGLDADVFLAWKGCLHAMNQCADPDLMRAMSLEPTIGPLLMAAPSCPPAVTFDPMAAQQPRVLPATGFTPPIQQPGAPNQQRFGAGGLPLSTQDFMRSQAGQYAKKTYNEANLRAHGYLSGGGQIQYPDGGH